MRQEHLHVVFPCLQPANWAWKICVTRLSICKPDTITTVINVTVHSLQEKDNQNDLTLSHTQFVSQTAPSIPEYAKNKTENKTFRVQERQL